MFFELLVSFCLNVPQGEFFFSIFFSMAKISSNKCFVTEKINRMSQICVLLSKHVSKLKQKSTVVSEECADKI